MRPGVQGHRGEAREGPPQGAQLQHPVSILELADPIGQVTSVWAWIESRFKTLVPVIETTEANPERRL